MNISPRIYLRFFDLLCRAIAEKRFPNEKKFPSLLQIRDAEISINGNDVNISTHFFHSPFKYFIDRRTEARKGSIVYIDDLRFVKAIEFIEKTPEKEEYKGDEWKVFAQVLLEKFEDKYFPDQKGLSNERLSSDQIESIFLKVVTDQKEVFESNAIKSLIYGYFEALNNKIYFKAWEMLSDAIKKNSIWDGDFLQFEILNSTFFESIEIDPQHTRDFVYEYQAVRCMITCSGNVSVFGENNFSFIMQKDVIEKFESDRERMQRKRLNIRYPVSSKRVCDYTANELTSVFFQMHLYALELEKYDPELRRKIVNLVDTTHEPRLIKPFNFDIHLTCRSHNNKWLIDEVHFQDVQYSLNKLGGEYFSF